MYSVLVVVNTLILACDVCPNIKTKFLKVWEQVLDSLHLVHALWVLCGLQGIKGGQAPQRIT